jgi:hypothetical protein
MVPIYPTVNAMSKTEQRSESEQDAMIIRLIGVAWVRVLELVRACCREDMVQDLVVERPRTSMANVHKYVAAVQRSFRKALRRTAVEPRPSVRVGGTPRTGARSVKRRYHSLGVRARSVKGVNRMARVVADLRPEPSAGRMLSPVQRTASPARLMESTAGQMESTAIEIESPARATVSPAASTESTVQPKVSTAIGIESPATTTVSPATSTESTAWPKMEPVAIKSELEHQTGTPKAAKVQLVARTVPPAPTIRWLGGHPEAPVEAIVSPVPRAEATALANVRPVAHNEASATTFESTARVKVATVCLKSEAAPIFCATATPPLQHAMDPATDEDRPEDVAHVSVYSRTVTRTHATRPARHISGR